MRAAVALLVSMTMTLAGCFPHDPHKQTIAKVTEGGALVAGIAISAFANTGADCDSTNSQPGMDPGDCRTHAQWLSTLGVTLILAGLLGFVATVSTAEDDDKAKTATTIIPDQGTTGTSSGSASTPTTPASRKSPGTTAGSGPGSADGAGSGSATTQPSP